MEESIIILILIIKIKSTDLSWGYTLELLSFQLPDPQKPTVFPINNSLLSFKKSILFLQDKRLNVEEYWGNPSSFNVIKSSKEALKKNKSNYFKSTREKKSLYGEAIDINDKQ